ncbi:MAG TPA: MoaD/ThiS family protein [Thermoplasmata archaeon]|nr:MoaD/ThiS family protein [Thermoplasmata archaeon]
MVGTVRVLLFSTARTAVGRAQLDWPVAPEGVRADELVRALGVAYPALSRVLRTARLVRNGAYLGRGSERLRAGDEFAVHPPYGGG